MKQTKIALVGSSSTGKTTVFELLKNKLPGFDFVNESTRTVKKYGFDINEGGNDETQLAIATFHLHSLLRTNNAVFDRSFLDVFVYSNSELLKIKEPTLNYITKIWSTVNDLYTHYIYFPIEFKAVDDGVRSINEDWRNEIDKAIWSTLRNNDLNYIAVTGSPLQRVSQILNFIDKPNERKL